MNTTHTPSPWIVSHDPDGSPDDYCIGVPDGKVDQIAVCSKRDAPLIAAAPDMYDALTECICGLEIGLDAAQIVSTLGDGRCAAIRSALTQARAALAKARDQ